MTKGRHEIEAYIPCPPPQPENAVKVKPFSLEDGSDPTTDTVLYDLAPFLRALATQVSLFFSCAVAPHLPCPRGLFLGAPVLLTQLGPPLLRQIRY